MIKVKKYVLTLASLAVCLFLPAQNTTNYGTDKAHTLMLEANKKLEQKKYEEAKTFYESVLATGDQMYAPTCREKLDFINRTLAQGKKNAIVFTISDDGHDFSYVGGQWPVIVDGAEKWDVSPQSYDDWCNVEIDRKKNKFIITVASNPTTEPREATLTVKSASGQKKTFVVTNEASPEVLRSSAQSLMFSPDGETTSVDIDANTQWNITDVPTWLNAIKGLDDIKFTATPNNENKDRIAQVKVETPSRNEITINIIQAAALDSLAFSKNDLYFGEDGGEELITVMTNADDWLLGAFPHWCQVTKVDDKTVMVHCTPNDPWGIPREASVNVTTGVQTLGINVYQEPKPIINVIPQDGIGGRKISFGFSLGYLYPMISTNSSSPYTYSAVNYAMSNQAEEASYSTSGGFSASLFSDIRLYKNLYLNAGVNFLYYKYKNELAGNTELTLGATSQYYLKGDGTYNYKEEYEMINLDVPILASYRISVTNKSHLQVNLGPVLSFGLKANLDISGKTDSESLRAYKITNGQLTDTHYDNYTYTHHVNYIGSFDMYSKGATCERVSEQGVNMSATEVSKFDASPFKMFNFGLRAGVAYEYMGISLGVSFQYMITNMANKKYWDGDRWTILNNAGALMTGYSQRNNLLQVTIGYTFRY